jgi:two-component system, cell cycle response regulator DivK
MPNRFYMPFLNLENKKLLVVEDDDMSFLYLNQLLKLTQCSLIREKSGLDAMEAFRAEPGFDLILMDIQLPDMDGKQVTRKIRDLDPIVPIIAQTAAKSPTEMELILASGCTEVIVKPFSMEELFSAIARHIDQ